MPTTGAVRTTTANEFERNPACTQCYDPTTRKFAREEKKHVHGLDEHQYTTLVLTSGVIAANLVSELRDVVLSGITARDGYAKSAKGPEHKVFAVILFLVKWTRQFAFCPGVLLVIPMVIMASGADVMALCFNTVAVLFILQVCPFCANSECTLRLERPTCVLRWTISFLSSACRR